MRKILLIEDNEGDILLFREALEDINPTLNLEIFRDGEKASSHISQFEHGVDQSHIPDLIILDINLPKVDGHELLIQIRNNITLSDIPVVILTTSSLENDIQRAYKNQANCYVTKPSELEQLFFVIGGIHNFWLRGDNINLA